ncbi:uncharacterized protein LOC135137818 [Zophobas morio]|uniref:uncharacterized protein LOC135137818 n=1 Tax=Zophobas morio TaxID=2755281 RepID=UPI0030831256
MDGSSETEETERLPSTLQIEQDTSILPEENFVPKTQLLNAAKIIQLEKSLEIPAQNSEQEPLPGEEKTEAAYESTKTFLKRSGTTDRGKDFENIVIANVILSLLSNPTITDFYISSNDDDFGAFDDVVIELHTGSKIETKAIQLKHSEQEKLLSIQHLKTKNEKANFGIRKYFESFQNIHSRAQEFLLFTNLKFVASEETKFQLEGEDFDIKSLRLTIPEGGLKFSDGVDYYYKFEVVEGEWTRQNPVKFEAYKAFFGKFCLHTDQKNVVALETSTFKEFTEAFSSNKDTFQKYVRVITEWNTQKGKKDKLNKEWMERAITLLLVGPQIEPLYVGLVNDKMKILRQAISYFDITLVEENGSKVVKELWGDFDTNNLHVVNKLRKKYCFPCEYIQDVKNLDGLILAQLLWLMDQSPLILRENSSVHKAIQLCRHQKFVLVVDNDETKECMKGRSVFQNLSNLTTNVILYEKIMQTFTVSLQGKEDLSLEAAFGNNKEFLIHVSTTNLTQMLHGPCYINGDKENLVDPYVERNFTRNTIDIKFLENASHTTLIIVNCGRNFGKMDHKKHVLAHTEDISNFLNNPKPNLSKPKIYISRNEFTHSEFQKVCQKASNFKLIKAIHFFKLLSTGNLAWIRSKGDVCDIDNFKIFDDFLNENEFWSCDDNKIRLITADPGMGKTELVKSLKNKCASEYLTVTVSPKDVNAFFENLELGQTDLTSSFQRFIFNQKFACYGQMDREFFKLCLERKLVVYIWDGLDEFLGEHLGDLSKVIVTLSEMGFIQWITSRQHLRSFLENEFSVVSVSISQFSESEQEDYIRKRLVSFVPDQIIEATIKNIKTTFAFIKHEDILGVPLQIFMLTEIVRQNNTKLNHELFTNEFLLTDLYHYFIQQKFAIFYRNEVPEDQQQPFLKRLLSDKTNETLRHYEKLALKVIFPEDILDQLNIDCRSSANLFEDPPVGLITKFENNMPQFLHVSFAEYFVASYFSKNFDHIPFDTFFSDKYTNMRFFFDLLLAKDSPAHIAVLYKKFELLETLDDEKLTRKDAAGRSALHLICSYGQKHPRLEVVQDSGRFLIQDKTTVNGIDTPEYFKAVMFLLEKCDVSKEDTLMEMTPLLYARESESLGAEMKILQTQELSLKQTHNKLDSINILYYSVLRGCDDLLQVFFSKEKGSISEGFARRLLMIACKKGYDKIVEYLVTCGVEVNRCDKNGRTPLHVASRNGHEKTVQCLVTLGAEVDLCNEEGRTPLYIAACYGYKRTVEVLVKSGAAVNRADNYGRTPLLPAALYGYTKTVKCLVESGAEISKPDMYGRVPLYVAAEYGHERVVRYLVKLGADVNGRDNYDQTALYAAAENGHEGNVRILLKSGAVVDSASNYGRTPLQQAACHGHQEVVEWLVRFGGEINHRDRYGRTPLYVASEYGQERTVRYLVELGADVDGKDNYDQTAIYAAAENGHEGNVRCLVEWGATIDSPSDFSRTPLQQAACHGHLTIVEYLVLLGAEINHADQIGRTPLYVASEYGREPTVEYLVASGASVNTKDKFAQTPLFAACENGHKKIVQFLVKSGAEVNGANQNGRMPLYIASCNGHEQTIEVLLKLCAEINRPDNYGRTSLLVASHQGHEKAVRCLVKYGADINYPDMYGRTPLYVASEYGFEKIVQFLVKFGADVNFRDKFEQTPLYGASEKGHRNVVECLVELGADVNVRNESGQTVEQVAFENGHQEVVEMLVKYREVSNRG